MKRWPNKMPCVKMEMSRSGRKVTPQAMRRGSIWRRGSEGLSLQWVNTENGNTIFIVF